MAQSKIDYVDMAWNPVTGCDPVSPGCDHCYARRMATRLRGRHGYPADEPFRVTLHPDRLGDPLRWKKARRIFTVSMGDLFHKDVPHAYRAAVFAVMAACPQHTFLVLTKRPDEAFKWFEWVAERERHGRELFPYDDDAWRIWQMLYVEGRRHGADIPAHHGGAWPLPNVWLGTTVCTPNELWKISEILKCPAAKHWVSLEPLLGEIRLTRIGGDQFGWGRFDALAGLRYVRANATECGCEWETKPTPKLDWVVCGGESGPGARPPHPNWVRRVRDDCKEAGTPFWFKQWGEWGPYKQCDWPDQRGWERLFDAGKRTHVGSDGSIGSVRMSGTWETLMLGHKKTGHLLDGKEHREMPKEA